MPSQLGLASQDQVHDGFTSGVAFATIPFKGHKVMGIHATDENQQALMTQRVKLK